MVERKGEVKFNFNERFTGLIYWDFGNVPANIKTECIEMGGYTAIIAESELLNYSKNTPGITHDRFCHKIFSIDLPFMITRHNAVITLFEIV